MYKLYNVFVYIYKKKKKKHRYPKLYGLAACFNRMEQTTEGLRNCTCAFCCIISKCKCKLTPRSFRIVRLFDQNRPKHESSTSTLRIVLVVHLSKF